LGLAAVSLWLRRSESTADKNLRIAKIGALLVLAFGLMQFAGSLFSSTDASLSSPTLWLRGGADAVAPNSALNFILLGFAIFSLDSSSSHSRIAAQCATFVAATVAITALLGYAYHIE